MWIFRSKNHLLGLLLISRRNCTITWQASSYSRLENTHNTNTSTQFYRTCQLLPTLHQALLNDCRTTTSLHCRKMWLGTKTGHSFSTLKRTPIIPSNPDHPSNGRRLRTHHRLLGHHHWRHTGTISWKSFIGSNRLLLKDLGSWTPELLCSRKRIFGYRWSPQPLSTPTSWPPIRHSNRPFFTHHPRHSTKSATKTNCTLVGYPGRLQLHHPTPQRIPKHSSRRPQPNRPCNTFLVLTTTTGYLIHQYHPWRLPIWSLLCTTSPCFKGGEGSTKGNATLYQEILLNRRWIAVLQHPDRTRRRSTSTLYTRRTNSTNIDSTIAWPSSIWWFRNLQNLSFSGKAILLAQDVPRRETICEKMWNLLAMQTRLSWNPRTPATLGHARKQMNWYLNRLRWRNPQITRMWLYYGKCVE